jgi:hypothetical protein
VFFARIVGQFSAGQRSSMEGNEDMRLGSFARIALAGVVTLATITATTTSASAAPAAAPAKSQGTITSVVDGTFGDGGRLTGTFTPSRFTKQGSQIVATGVLHGVLTNADGSSAGTADTPVTVPVQLPSSSSASTDAAPLAVGCNVLHLVLGPLDLNLLGLTVHLNTVVLDITAVPGPGNLLGNLLCALAGLLDGASLPLGQITALLNSILALLGLLGV